MTDPTPTQAPFRWRAAARRVSRLAGRVDAAHPPPAVAAEAASWAADGWEAYCFRCGATTAGAAIGAGGCPHCVGRPVPWDRMTRLAAYTEPMDGWIKAMKYGRRWSIGPWLGARLGAAVGEAAPNSRWPREGPVVVHAPMHWTRRWRRGFDQAALMADGLAKARGWRHEPLLKRVQRTAAQTSIPPSQRPANVRHAFAMAEVDLEGRDVILVDDVKTTGATLARCARLLRQHGARTIHATVAAVADPRGQDFTAV